MKLKRHKKCPQELQPPMNKITLALTALAGITIVTGLYLSDPVTQSNRYQASNLRRYQQSQLFDIFSLFYPLFLFLLLLALVAVVVIAAKAFALRYTNVDQLAEQRMYQRDIWFIEHDNRVQYPNLTHLNYSPRHSDSHNLSITQHHKQHKALAAGAAVTDGDSYAQQMQVQQIPTFAEALQMPLASNSLILGYDEYGAAKLGTLDNLFSFGIGGASGSGKTSTCIWLLSQAIMQGAKLIVIDPHAGNPDSLASKLQPLSSSYLCDVATSENEMLQAINFAQSIFDARKSGADVSTNHIIIVCDEWMHLMRGSTSEAFKVLAEGISQEGRKYGIIGSFLSQKWSVSKSGDMRDTLTSHIICRTRPNLARQQTGLLSSDLPSDVMQLETGSYYLLNVLGELQKLSAPYVSNDDLIQLSKTIDIAPAPHLSSSPNDAPQQTAEHAAIIQKFKTGSSIAEISRELSGSKSGSKYIKALNQINDVLRIELN